MADEFVRCRRVLFVTEVGEEDARWTMCANHQMPDAYLDHGLKAQDHDSMRNE